MKRLAEVTGCALLLLIAGSGCNQEAVEGSANRENLPAIDKTKYVLNAEPDGAVGVMIAREDAQDQQEIALVGRIGGSKNPWIKGRAAFMVIDAAMTVIADGEEAADGQVCMDDCCASLRADCTTLVKIVDERGKPLPVDARELLDVKENDMIVAQGIVERSEEEGTFVIAARGIYVRR